ncbi:hypothetical protein ACOMHN_039440 [Nucella lapillus]
MESRWAFWCFCLTVVVTLSFGPTFVSCEGGLGVKCWVCSFQNATCTRQQGKPYYPALPVDNYFCSGIRNNDAMLRELCRSFPHGYHLNCDRTGLPSMRCKNDLCPSDPKRQTGNHSGASFHSHHVTGFLSVVSAVLVLWLIG